MSSQSRVGTVIEDKFRLDEQIGQGSMGAVYRGTQLMVDRPVAVKLLHPNFAGHEKIQARFEREARAIARLNHPNCITLFDFGYSEDMEAFYTVVEYIDGVPLEALVDQPLSVSRVVELIKQTASALGHAHHHGILHRDLKPENIMLADMTDGSEIVKVLDFGIAQIMQGHGGDDDDDFETDRLTRVGEVFGTPPYMSPEQSESTHDLSPATDLYSLGIIFYELLDSRLPFLADTPVEIMAMHRTEDPPPLRRSDVPGSVRGLLFEMLEKSPEDRPEGGDVIVDRLGAIPDAELPDSPPSASTDGERQTEKTLMNPPDDIGADISSDSTLLSAPPQSDAVTAATGDGDDGPAPGEESELYELQDLVEPPPDAESDGDAPDADPGTGDRPEPTREPTPTPTDQDIRATRLVDPDAEPEDSQLVAVVSDMANSQRKMIATVIAVLVLVGAGLGWIIIEHEPFSLADEEDLDEVAGYAAGEPPPADERDEEFDDFDDDFGDIADSDDDADELADDPPREVAVSDDEEESDEESEEEQDEVDEEDEEADEPADEPATGQPSPEPRPEPAEEPTPQDRPPRLGEPDDDEPERDGPPRLDL